jgi:mRNA-degrading endonuclease RelE of RelBE toxin-antitoxin system
MRALGMPECQIEFTEEAKADLDYYAVFERKIITSEIRVQLAHQPSVDTKSRKSLRENPVASWELRAGKFRVFYEVDDTLQKVTIVAVGHKEHNVLQGKEVVL